MTEILFPTYEQVVEIPLGTMLSVTTRERSGERAILTGLLHMPESGHRKVGPYTVARMVPMSGGIYADPANRPLRPHVPVEIIGIETHTRGTPCSSPATSPEGCGSSSSSA